MIKSIRLRKFLQFISVVVFPITINYLSPYLIVMASLKGVMNGSLILFLVLLVSGIFLGRLWCSTLCPAGAAGDYLSEVNSKKVKNGRYNLIKWFIWIPWLAGIISGYVSAGGIKEFNPLFMTESGISVDRVGAYIIYLGVFFLVTFVNVAVGKRAMCHYICWMAPFMILGIKIRKLLHLPGLTLTAQKDACVSCGKCTKVCPMSLDVMKDMVQKERMTHEECILCGTCIQTCPKDVIDMRFTKT